MNKKYSILLSILITLFIILNVFIIKEQSSSSNREKVIISRIIDGDTLELEDGRIIRLLNVNSPEKNIKGAEASKEFLQSLVSKQVEIEITSKDKYFRNLAKIYVPNYINLDLVKKGLASKFLVQKDELKQFRDAEIYAINNSLGIWHKSPLFGCLNTSIDHKKEIVYFVNLCPTLNISGWSVKDESRKIYYFNLSTINKISLHTGIGKDNSTDIFWNSPQSIWNNDRDSLYLYDKDGNIANYETYGY